MIGRCRACVAKDDVIMTLRAELQERDKTLLAMWDPVAYKARYPAPPAPKPEPAPQAAVPLLTRDQLRNQQYNPPIAVGQTARDIEAEFALEVAYGPGAEGAQ